MRNPESIFPQPIHGDSGLSVTSDLPRSLVTTAPLRNYCTRYVPAARIASQVLYWRSPPFISYCSLGNSLLLAPIQSERLLGGSFRGLRSSAFPLFPSIELCPCLRHPSAHHTYSRSVVHTSDLHTSRQSTEYLLKIPCYQLVIRLIHPTVPGDRVRTAPSPANRGRKTPIY